jgi:putative membrane protein
VLHSLLGFVISLLLAFRTNTAYERWWEGRKAWGTLVNHSRNLALYLDAMLPDSAAEEREFMSTHIANYAASLRDHLRNKRAGNAPQHIEHEPNYVAGQLIRQCNDLYKNGVISGEQLITISPHLHAFTDILGICERIRKTPIPYSYSLFLKKFIFVYIISMPFSFISDFGYWVIPAVTFVFYVLASLELIAEEIEDPFGTDANDLPTDEMAITIRDNVRGILRVTAK